MNSVDSVQVLHVVASALGLQYLHMSPKHHFARFHIHTDIKVCNFEEPQKYRLGTANTKLLEWRKVDGGGAGLKVVLLDPNRRLCFSKGST